MQCLRPDTHRACVQRRQAGRHASPQVPMLLTCLLFTAQPEAPAVERRVPAMLEPPENISSVLKESVGTHSKQSV